MANEEEILREIFGENKKWKNKYKITWCDSCNCVSLKCPSCEYGSSCNGTGCDECSKDFKDFNTITKRCVESYLTKEEIVIYNKCISLKKHILESINNGEDEINFKKRRDDGEFSEWEIGIFKSFLE